MHILKAQLPAWENKNGDYLLIRWLPQYREGQEQCQVTLEQHGPHTVLTHRAVEIHLSLYSWASVSSFPCPWIQPTLDRVVLVFIY